MGQVLKRLVDFFDKRTRRSIMMVIGGTLIYSVAVVWLLNSGEFFAGGITGISQLISKAIWGEITPIVGIFIGVINLPLFIFGTRGVSKKFAVLTLLSVLLQTIVIALFQKIADSGFNPIEPLVTLGVSDTGNTIFDNGARLLVAILGGALSGYGLAMCLKAGGSSGGMDVIANYLLVKKDMSFTKYSFVVFLVYHIMSIFPSAIAFNCIQKNCVIFGDIFVAIYKKI